MVDRALTQVTSGPGPDLSSMRDPAAKGIYFVNGKSSASLTLYHVRSKQSADISSENISQPSISPDGRHVLYVKFLGRPDQSELWVSDLEGANNIKLASSGELGTGDWSRDSSQLTFFDAGENKALRSGQTVGDCVRLKVPKFPCNGSCGRVMGDRSTSASPKGRRSQVFGKPLLTARIRIPR